MPGAPSECGRKRSFPSSISISVESAFLQLTAREHLLYAKRIKADLSIRAANFPGIWPEETCRLAIQLGVCEFASVIFVSSIFGSSQCSARATRAESP